MIEVAVDGYVPAQKTAGGTERSGPGAGGDRGPGRGPGRVCTSLQEALDLLEEDPALERLILVYPGIYREQVTVRVPGVTIQAVPFDDLGRDREIGTDRAGADRAGADRAGADRAGADRAGADRAGADRAGADRTGAEGQVAADRVPGVPQQETAGVGDQAAGRGADGSWGDVIVTWGLGAKEILEDGKKRGTFRTYTFFVDADDVTLKGLTIENHAGPGTQVGQAIALYADGDRLVVDSCRLLGWQDTLFTAPLPPVEIEKDGFIGPKQSAPRRENRQYYKDCYIEGEVDFIFGGATAYFETCTFFSKYVDREVKGYVTAPSTPEGLPFGYVMESCRFRSNCPDGSVYLGRPWREWGRAVLLRCVIGPHIKAEGWDDWGKELAHTTSFFAEYACTGPGAAAFGAGTGSGAAALGAGTGSGAAASGAGTGSGAAASGAGTAHGLGAGAGAEADGDMDTKKERRPSDAGSSSRPAWCHSLDTRAAEAYTRENVLKGTDGWDPGL